MSPTKQERNKALVLEAFDTLFNKRDYGAAERYWSPTYIQHSAHIAPGREGLFNLIKSMPPALQPKRFFGLREIDRRDTRFLAHDISTGKRRLGAF
jgi:hypothetical protein